MKKQAIISAMNKGLVEATGCTEPIAIAYAAAVAGSYTSESILSLDVYLSPSIVKNAFVVQIPNTNLTGLQHAAALGVNLKNPQKGLDLMADATHEIIAASESLVRDNKVQAHKTMTEHNFYIDVKLKSATDNVEVIISGHHTNVVFIKKNNDIILDKRNEQGEADEMHSLGFDLKDIYEFCQTVSLDELEPIKKAMRLNLAICQEGLHEKYGLQVGRTILTNIEKKRMADDLVNYAMALTAAGSDARMGGANLSVMSNSGSGNQGITATMPVLAVAHKMSNCSEELTIRACALSNLATIYIKARFGVLSALCGAVVAGAGAACGVTYLLEGSFEQIEYALHNTIGNVAGMLCDGAKASCALKVSSCTNAALQAAFLALENLRIPANEGIVARLSDVTIENLAALGNQGTSAMDQLILDMIIYKNI